MNRRIAWITGGGRGIGRACAIALAREGCDVAVSARTASELHTTANECKALKVRAVEAPCDVTNRARVDAAYRHVSSELGKPNVLVNAAGLARSAPFLKTTPEFLESLWKLNVVGTFHCMQAALPAMVDTRWGRIVNIASISGIEGAPYIAAYAATKHAVVGLTKSVAAEFGGKGIRVNAVCPGYVDTKMTQENLDVMARETGRSRQELLDRIAAMNPQGRLITPEEVAEVVVSLAIGTAGDEANGLAITIPLEVTS